MRYPQGGEAQVAGHRGGTSAPGHRHPFLGGRGRRGLIDLFYCGTLIGQEIIETADSWKKKDRLFDYREVLRKKIRLVVMAPRADAMKVRIMMLELNNWWLFYIWCTDMTRRPIGKGAETSSA